MTNKAPSTRMRAKLRKNLLNLYERFSSLVTINDIVDKTGTPVIFLI
jgi:hypothetical protein